MPSEPLGHIRLRQDKDLQRECASGVRRLADSLCPTAFSIVRGMKKRVTLEPELEAIAGALSPFDRLWLAKKLRRWIRQLEVSARVLSAPPRRPGRRLPRQVARWN